MVTEQVSPAVVPSTNRFLDSDFLLIHFSSLLCSESHLLLKYQYINFTVEFTTYQVVCLVRTRSSFRKPNCCRESRRQETCWHVRSLYDRMNDGRIPFSGSFTLTHCRIHAAHASLVHRCPSLTVQTFTLCEKGE